MKRRTFITLVGSAIACLPLATRAQQAGRIRRIGVLMTYADTDREPQARVAAFTEELAKLGWIEDRNIRVDIRWATDDARKISRFAQELVASAPDLILSSNTPSTAALASQTRSVPIVFATVADPVGSGFVASLRRPGGNVTGFTNLEGSIAGKWLELLKEVAPRTATAAMFFDPATAPFAQIYLDPFKSAAASLGLKAISAPVHDASELESAIAELARAPNPGFIVMPGPFVASRSAHVISLAARHNLPAVYPFRHYAELGGLLSYGNDQADNYRRAARYVDRILNGEKPGELPVQAPVKFELAINLKTAKALGLDVPSRLLQLADTVLE